MIPVIGSALLLTPAVILDVREKRLPTVFLLLFGAVGVIVSLISKSLEWPEVLIGIAIGGLFLVLSKITREQIAYGDGVLIAALGAWIGGAVLSGAVLIGLLSGGIFGVALILIRRKSRKYRLPFAPFLAFGAAVMLFFSYL